MKKLIIMMILSIGLVSCKQSNIILPSDNPKIPNLITELANSKLNLVKKDSILNIDEYKLYSFDDGNNLLYEYKVYNNKVLLDRIIVKTAQSDDIILLIVSMFIIIFIMLIIILL